MACRIRVFHPLRSAVAVAGLAAVAAISVHGQGQQPAAPAPPAAIQDPIPAAQLSFMAGYAGQPVKTLLKDKRYKALVKRVIPNTTFHYGRDMSPADALDAALWGSKVPVVVRDGRYVTIGGAQGRYLRGRGFMWFDIEAGTALGVFYFQPTNGEPTPTLTVFSRQLTQTDLSMGQLPPAFSQDLNAWKEAAQIPIITPRYFIPANGKKYVLLHDEEYCAAPPGTAAPAANVCQQLMAEAADADVNAAYFMRESHNAANATAWMLGPEQVAWFGMRNSTCGAMLGCRIRLTRARTLALIGPR